MNAIIRSYGDADSDAELRSHTLDDERPGNRCRDTTRQICRVIKGGDFGHDDRELIPTNSGKKCVRADNGGDPPGKFTQRFITHGVAVDVVDQLETVEFHHENGHLMRRAGGTETLLKPFLEKPTVRQSGQRVVPGEIARLQLRDCTCLDFARDVPITTKGVNHHRETEDKYHEDDVVGFMVSVVYPKLK
jgi:hypothetical protein